VTLVPDLPGDLVITTAMYREFEQATVGQPTTIIPSGASLKRVSVGRRRVLVDGTMDQSPHARSASLELHTDGAGAYAFQLYDRASGRRRQAAADTDGPAQQVVDDEAIVLAVLTGPTRLAEHTRDRAAAGGDAVTRAMLVPATSAQSVEIGYARRNSFAERPRP
jgi:hypothetical protein